MKPFGALLPFEEAKEIVEKHIQKITRKETVYLESAVGRVLAGDIKATQNTPPFDRGSMDGYAVKAENTTGAGPDNPVVLKMVGDIHAGDSPDITVGQGECIQMATGAVMPEGADAVVMVEDTESDKDGIKIFKAYKPLSNVSKKGSDIQAGTVVLKDGTYLDAGKVGVLASQGLEKVEVYARPRVAVMPSGEEVVPPGKELNEGQLYDINSYTIQSVIKENGGIPLRPGILSDNLEDIRSKITGALKESDILVFSGGSSVGDRDLIAEVIAERGVILFHGLMIKPGKPTMFAIIDNKPVFGMPGFPTSSLINSILFVAPALRKMAGLPRKRAESVEARLSRKTSGDKVRMQFMTVKLEGDEAIPVFTQSGAITSIAQADGYFSINPGEILEEGAIVAVTLF